jgi:hypothetical protein
MSGRSDLYEVVVSSVAEKVAQQGRQAPRTESLGCFARPELFSRVSVGHEGVAPHDEIVVDCTVPVFGVGR